MDNQTTFVSEVRKDFIPNAVVVSLYIIVGVLANLTVIITYATRMKQTISQRYFIPYLATVDLISCIFNGVSNAVLKMNFFTFESRGSCKFIRFFGTFLVLYSVFLLLAISVQRYLIICTKRSHIIDNKRKQLMLIILIPSVVIAIPRWITPDASSLFIPGKNETVWMCEYSPIYRNSVELKIEKNVLMAILFLVVGTISTLYALIMRKIIVSNRKTKKYKANPKTDQVLQKENHPQIEIPLESNSGSLSTQETSDDKDSCKNEIETPTSRGSSMRQAAKISKQTVTSPKAFQRRLCFMFMAISFICVATYLPRVVVEMKEARDPYFFVNASSSERIIYALFSSMYISHHVINPFIYGLCDIEFRRNIRFMFKTLRMRATA